MDRIGHHRVAQVLTNRACPAAKDGASLNSAEQGHQVLSPRLAQSWTLPRAHQFCGGRPPAERFALSGRDVVADDSAIAAAVVTPAAGMRPARVLPVGEGGREDLGRAGPVQA